MYLCALKNQNIIVIMKQNDKFVYLSVTVSSHNECVTLWSIHTLLSSVLSCKSILKDRETDEYRTLFVRVPIDPIISGMFSVPPMMYVNGRLVNEYDEPLNVDKNGIYLYS